LANSNKKHMPVFSDEGINKYILKNFNKTDILIKLNTNFKKERSPHDFQLMLFLALTFEREDNLKNAIIYYKQFLEYSYQIEDHKSIALCHNRIGVNHFKLREYDISLNYHEKCLEFISENEKFVVFYNLALNWRFLKNLEKAHKYFEKALSLSEKIQDKRGIAISIAQKGLCLFEERKYAQARELLEVI
jgi:tetratricopeptide (TPR) repeat protein